MPRKKSNLLRSRRQDEEETQKRARKHVVTDNQKRPPSLVAERKLSGAQQKCLFLITGAWYLVCKRFVLAS